MDIHQSNKPLTDQQSGAPQYSVHVNSSTLLMVNSSSVKELNSNDPQLRVFAPCSLTDPEIEIAPVEKLEDIKRYVQQKRHPLPSYRYGKTFDKVEARQSAAKVAILPQPEWIDLRHLLDTRGHEIQFSKFDFSNLPLEELLTNNSQLQFGAINQGFSIHATEGKLAFRTNNSSVAHYLGQDEEPLTLTEAYRRLTLLGESGFTVTSFARGNTRLRKTQLTQAFASIADGTWYLKDIGGSFGNQVAKIKIEKGELRDVTIAPLPESLFQDEQAATLSPLGPHARLDFMCQLCPHGSLKISAAILERSIPTERADGILAEQRALFAFKHDPYFLCSYSKTAQPNEFIPNRSQNGNAEPVNQSFARILAAHGLQDEDLERETLSTKARYKELLTRFAHEFIAEAETKGCHYGPLFGIDTAPVWNSETQQIDFHLIEVQPRPGSVGAGGNIPPDEQEMVDAYNKSTEEFDDYTMHL